MIAYLNGKFLNKLEIKISPFNEALLYGKGFFETLRTLNSKPFRLDDHIKRLNNSLSFFGYKNVDPDEIKFAITELIRINKLSSTIIRITVSKNILEEEQILLINMEEYKPTFSEFVSVTIYPERQAHNNELRKHKSTNYLLNKIAYQHALSNGYDEALFVDNFDHLLEGTRTNVFMISQDTVYTPSLKCGLLPGITRQIVFEIAEELGIKYQEKVIHLSELKQSDEIFLTNSINGIIKVKNIDEKYFDNFKITDKFRMIYEEMLKS